MNGREDKQSNDLFYTCGLIEYISRKTQNKPSLVVRFLGSECIARIYDLADIYHSDNIDRVSDDLIEEHNIPNGDFDNIAACEYSIPTHWDIGKVYKRLILAVSAENGDDIVTTHSWTYILHGSLTLSRIITAASTMTILLQFWRPIKMDVFQNRI